LTFKLRRLTLCCSSSPCVDSETEVTSEEDFEIEHAVVREQMREHARHMRKMLKQDADLLRSQIAWMAQMSDSEIEDKASWLENTADSRQPLSKEILDIFVE
jgi:uncharacterized protein YecT (DUF1311 family)